MTREEAIKCLKQMKIDMSHISDAYVAIMTAIEALSQQLCNDIISRSEAIDACDQSVNVIEATDRIKELRGVVCEDAISRRAVLHIPLNLRYDDIINSLPPVHAEPRTGHWIDRSEGGRIIYPWMEAHECSECGKYGSAAWDYCPNCGAKMEG